MLAGLWFYSKNETTNFENDIANSDGFSPINRSLINNKAQLTEGKNAQLVPYASNGILKNATIALKYLSNFWRSVEIPLINCKESKLYVPVVTVSPKNNQKLSKVISKEFGRSVYWN